MSTVVLIRVVAKALQAIFVAQTAHVVMSERALGIFHKHVDAMSHSQLVAAQERHG
jgi:hypothetical protein